MKPIQCALCEVVSTPEPFLQVGAVQTFPKLKNEAAKLKVGDYVCQPCARKLGAVIPQSQYPAAVFRVKA